MPAAAPADVIVAGGGPAGSTVAWALARRGLRVVVLERASFPARRSAATTWTRAGIVILRAMGALQELQRTPRVKITRTATFVDWERRYSGPIPFYGTIEGLPPYGLTIPREELDAAMLEAAARAGAQVHEDTAVTEVEAGAGGVEVSAEHGSRSVRYRARLIVGADGVNSVVARSQGLTMDDERRTAVARRAYALVDAPAGETGEADIFYDRESFPGYGWMFTASDGRVNLGVGLLSEARARDDVHVPSLFVRFVEGLRRNHPRCAGLELDSKPIGGVVKMYGGAGPNHFDGGVLIGDAGSFVDPMTGEGITPGMESALLAAPVLADALDVGDASAARLAPYEAAFRAYFDPSMMFLDFCAEMLRNRHLKKPWLKALARGCQVAQENDEFARTCGSYFGGLEIRPFDILGQVWLRSLEDALLAWPRFFAGLRGAEDGPGTSPGDLLDWQIGFSRSLLSDPRWHLSWTLDMQRQWTRLLSAADGVSSDPRAAGLLHV